jgi:flavorubredoxin
MNDAPASNRGTVATRRPREIRPGVWWIPACLSVSLSGQPVHIHSSPYLILAPEGALLWDTGESEIWPELEPSLDELLGSRPLDYVVPSHSELPHSGNLHRVLAKYPDARAIGDVRDYHLYFPHMSDRFDQLIPGSRVPLGGGYVHEVLPAIIKDLPHSQWGYEHHSRVLFTADAFSYSHRAPVGEEDRPVHSPAECSLFASELEVVPGPDQIIWITRAALYWARFLPMDTYLDTFEQLLETHPTDIIAPAHGAVIDDMSLIPVIWKALNMAYDPDGGVKGATESVVGRV